MRRSMEIVRRLICFQRFIICLLTLAVKSDRLLVPVRAGEFYS
jgi:hypothetical protein